MHGINIIKSVFMHFPLKAQRGWSIPQAVSRRPLIVEAGIRSQTGQYMPFVMGKVSHKRKRWYMENQNKRWIRWINKT